VGLLNTENCARLYLCEAATLDDAVNLQSGRFKGDGLFFRYDCAGHSDGAATKTSLPPFPAPVLAASLIEAGRLGLLEMGVSWCGISSDWLASVAMRQLTLGEPFLRRGRDSQQFGRICLNRS
jgi:hypothetical protein